MRHVLCLLLLAVAVLSVTPSTAEAWFPRRQSININIRQSQPPVYMLPAYVLPSSDRQFDFSFSSRSGGFGILPRRESVYLNSSSWDGGSSFSFQRSRGCGPGGCR